MSKYIITPWGHPRDLLQIRDQLYGTPSNPPNASEQRKAISRIHAWKLRGNLPHAIESTALLLDATLHHHEQWENQKNSRTTAGTSDFSIRATYTAAFTRFVTGFCDIGRSKDRTLEVRSMLEIAREIGMPAAFVALRHEATHEEMPSLRRLVGAVERGLEWLWGVYWCKLEEQSKVEDVRKVKSEVESVLREFRKGRRDGLRGKREKRDLTEDARKVCGGCVEMCGGSGKRMEVLAEVVVEERLLLPGSRELGSSLEGAFLIWDDFLDMCFAQMPSLQRRLLKAFMRNLEKPSQVNPAQDVEKEANAMWLLHILDETHSMPSEVVKWCCLHPGYWSEDIGRKILRDYASAAEWQELFEVSLLTAGDGTSGGQSRMADIEMTDETSAPADHAEGSSTQGWSRAVAPIALPIGVVS